jgi:hypothetical protein
MTIEDKAKELRTNLRCLMDSGFANFDTELDLLDFLLGDKCSYVYDIRERREGI